MKKTLQAIVSTTLTLVASFLFLTGPVQGQTPSVKDIDLQAIKDLRWANEIVDEDDNATKDRIFDVCKNNRAIHLTDGADTVNSAQKNNYLCGKATLLMEYTQNGIKPLGYECTRYGEGSNQNDKVWDDNYLCVPDGFPFDLQYHPSGTMTAPAGGACLALTEAEDPWKDNFLCFTPNDHLGAYQKERADAQEAKRAAPVNLADMASISWHNVGTSNDGKDSQGKDVQSSNCMRGDVQIVEPAHPLPKQKLDNNYLCGTITNHMQWSVAGEIDGKRCTRFFENNNVGTAVDNWWFDNYLCVESDFPFDLKFSSAGELTTVSAQENGGCVALKDAAGWVDNYLCWEPNKHFAKLVDASWYEVAKSHNIEVPWPRTDDELSDLDAVWPPLPLPPVHRWNKDSIKSFVAALNNDQLIRFVNALPVIDRHTVMKYLSDAQAETILNSREMILTWHIDGPELGKSCTRISEVQTGWDNVFLCANRDFGFRWSANGRLAGMKCHSFFERVVNGKNSEIWRDNFLCVPPDFEYDMLFVSAKAGIKGMQDKCINLGFGDQAGTTNASWNDNYLCADRDRLISYNGHWEAATPPCPTCPEIDYSVSYGVEKGEEKSSDSSWHWEVGIETETKAKIPLVGETTVHTSTNVGHDWSSSISNSFSRSKDEEISVPCHLGAVWQWVSTMDRTCSFGTPCPQLTARSNIIQCTVPGDEPPSGIDWQPCEPVFVDNLSVTTARQQNAGTRSDTPGGWRCRGANEIIIDKATYGRSCNAQIGNVTDLVTYECQDTRDSDGAPGNPICSIKVDPNRFGTPGGEDCSRDFEVTYTCPEEGDVQRRRYVSGSADGSEVTLSCRAGQEDVVTEGIPLEQTKRTVGSPLIEIEQATYGRSCNAPVGNVTDFVELACQQENSSCDFKVDKARFGQIGGPECPHNFEVVYTCENDRDLKRVVRVDGEAGHNTNVRLDCTDPTNPVVLTGSPDPNPGSAKSTRGDVSEPKKEPKLDVKQASYGRNCGAPAGNATDQVSFACTGNDLSCTYVVDTERLGDVGNPDCERSFEVFYSCPGNDDDIWNVFVPGEAGFRTPVTLTCDPAEFQPMITAAPNPVNSKDDNGSVEDKVLPEIDGASSEWEEESVTIKQATYGRNCGAPVGNVTDLVAFDCQDSVGSCEYKVNMDRLGDVGRPECARNFEVFFSCPGDDDFLRSAYVPGEAGYNTTVPLNCGDYGEYTGPITVPAVPNPVVKDAVSDDMVDEDETAAISPPVPTEMTINSVTIKTPDLTITAPALNVETPEVTVSADSIPVHGHSEPTAAPQPVRTPKIPYCVVPMPRQNQCAPQNPQPSDQGYQDTDPNAPQPYDPGYPQTGDSGYPQPQNPGYPQTGDSGYPQPQNPGYPQTGDSGYPQPQNPGYPQTGDSGYPQPNDPGYPQTGVPAQNQSFEQFCEQNPSDPDC